MFRIIILLLSSFIFLNNEVNAEEEIWYEEELEQGMISEKRYKFYTIEKEGDYVSKKEESQYQYEDVNDIQYSEYSNWKDSCSTDYYSYEVEFGTENEFQELTPIHYLKIINTNDFDISIKNINIYNHIALLKHDIYSYSDFLINSNTIKPNGYVIIHFPMFVKMELLKVIIELNESDATYEMYFSGDRYFQKLVAYTEGNSNISEYTYNENYTLYDNYTDVYTGYNVIENDFTKVLSTKNVCREREIMTFRYNIIRKYIDDNYYATINDIIDFKDEDKSLLKKDEEEFKIYYRYKNENDLEEDNLVNIPLKLVNTGIEMNTTTTKEEKNYNYLIIYVLVLMFIASILLIYKNVSIKKND